MRILIAVLATIAVCVVVTLIGLAIVAKPEGYPMLNFWYWMCLFYLTAGITCRAVASSDFADRLGAGIGNWIRAGGFWAVWSESNTPANTWVTIALIAIGSALTYGPPSPKVDWENTKYQSITAVNKQLARPAVQDATKGAKDLTNYLAKGLIGREVLDSKVPLAVSVEKPEPKYHRSWFRIIAALLASLFALVVWVWSRRDDVGDKLHELAGKFRKHREEKMSSTDGGGGAGPGKSMLDMVIKQTSFGNQVAEHIIGELFSRVGESFFGGIAKKLKG